MEKYGKTARLRKWAATVCYGRFGVERVKVNHTLLATCSYIESFS